MKPILLLAALLLLGFTLRAAEPPSGIMVLDGRSAPALQLKDLDGKAYDLAERRGRWVFVHFWASWCGPCRREMPTIQKLTETLADDRLEIIMVNTAETEDAVFSFLGIVAPDLMPLMDTDGLVTEAWQPRGLPATFLVDPEGNLRYLAYGGREWDTQPYLDFLRSLIGRSS